VNGKVAGAGVGPWTGRGGALAATGGGRERERPLWLIAAADCWDCSGAGEWSAAFGSGAGAAGLLRVAGDGEGRRRERERPFRLTVVHGRPVSGSGESVAEKTNALAGCAEIGGVDTTGAGAETVGIGCLEAAGVLTEGDSIRLGLRMR
jgi:hypothetical protein